MLDFFKGIAGSIVRSSLTLTVLFTVAAGTTVLVIQNFAGWSPTYRISLQVVGRDYGGTTCDAAAMALMKEEVRNEAYKYVNSTNSMRTQVAEYQLRLSTKLDDKDLIEDVSEGNYFLLAVQEFFGSKPSLVDVFVRVKEKSCDPVDAVIFFDDVRRLVPLASPGDFSRLAIEIVNSIDGFIPVARLALDYRTLEEARRASFKEISRGRQSKWYKNLVAFSYLQEADIFDPIANEKIVAVRLEKAEYWLNSALDEDAYFLPAKFNQIYISVERGRHTVSAYDSAIATTMNLYYRHKCGECLYRAALLRFERYNRMSNALTAYPKSAEDLSRARSNLEYKIMHHGATDNDIYLLSRVVNLLERSEYQNYLKLTARPI